MNMSQDEVDRLISQAEPVETHTKPAAPPASDPGIDTFKQFTGLFADAVRNIAPILAGGNQIVVNVGQPVIIPLSDLIQSKRTNVVFYMVKQPSLFSNPLLGWIDTPLCLGIAKRMMGQEEETELNEVLLSAVNEAFNNIFGAFDTSLKEEFAIPVEHSDFKIFEGEVARIIPAETSLAASQPMCTVSLSFKMEGLSGGMGLMTPVDSLSILHSHHPSSKKMTTPTPKPENSTQVPSKATVPLTSKHPVREVPVAKFEDLTPHRTTGESRGVELILDVPLSVTVELGRKKLSVKEVLELVPGSLVELDKLAGENVDLYVNGKLFAKGEVVVIDESFGVRISMIVTPKERLERLK